MQVARQIVCCRQCRRYTVLRSTDNLLSFLSFFLNETATTEIYTLHIVGSVRCVQETVSTQSTWVQLLAGKQETQVSRGCLIFKNWKKVVSLVADNQDQRYGCDCICTCLTARTSTAQI
eukprot:TRINITY_DN26839_c0_g1_i1.p3 TRINITY_DN26839_c0_g1~~TRINITY_DN26839_c0_g1_i1.p3  ORF type:complete len:119 (+),score=11.50 TRINITY_DN26839_c0_g1_i1:24-380(+)